jgi:hypothetical protein
LNNTRRPLARLSTMLGVTAALVGVTLAVTTTGGPARAATAPSPQLPANVVAAARAASVAGFAHISDGDLKTAPPITGAALTPGMLVELGTPGPAYVDHSDGVAITGPTRYGSVIVIRANESGFGFGIVTTRHGHLQFEYKTVLAPGTTVKPATDGGLNQVSSAGVVLSHIDPAYAVDSTGKRLPASYAYNSRSDELIVTANTDQAKGAVFIDPSWKCIAEASAYGALWVLAAAAWLFSDGTVTFLVWALRAWYGLSLGAADHIAQACAL